MVDEEAGKILPPLLFASSVFPSTRVLSVIESTVHPFRSCAPSLVKSIGSISMF